MIALALAVIGLLTSDRRRWPWLALVIVGVLLALGYYNPLNWTLASLPGFNLFRVPARWLALVTLGLAMLAGIIILGETAGTYLLSELVDAPPHGTAVAVGVVLVGARTWGIRREDPTGPVILLVTLAGVLVPVSAFGDPRFKVPLEPTVALLAAFALVQIWSWIRGARTRRSDPAEATEAATATESAA